MGGDYVKEGSVLFKQKTISRRCKMRKITILTVLFAVLLPFSALAVMQEEWAKKYDSGGNDSVTALAMDSLGNVYVAGTTSVIKYNSTGEELWVKNASVVAMSVDVSGNAYITGAAGTVKYDINGNESWARNAPAEVVATDSSGNVYVVGSTIAIKYDPNGNELWTRNIPSGYIAIDSSGNLYVSRRHDTSGRWGFGVIHTTKYDANGNELWTAQYGRSGYNTYYSPKAITVDSSGNVYVAGRYSWAGNYRSKFITVKYDSNGKQLWSATSAYVTSDGGSPSAIGADDNGNVYVATLGNWGDGYLTIKYDANGNRQWANNYTDAGLPTDIADSIPFENTIGASVATPTALAIDSTGNVYVTGTVNSPGASGESDIVTIKYDVNGNTIWDTARGREIAFHESSPIIALDASGNAYVAETVSGPRGDSDYVVLKYGSSAP